MSNEKKYLIPKDAESTEKANETAKEMTVNSSREESSIELLKRIDTKLDTLLIVQNKTEGK